MLISHPSKTILFTCLYTALNVLIISIQHIPGLVTYFLFGALFPFILSIGVWFYLKKSHLSKKQWRVVSSIFSVYYFSAGFLSLYYIGNLWAGV
jgi:hypothetical protein